MTAGVRRPGSVVDGLGPAVFLGALGAALVLPIATLAALFSGQPAVAAILVATQVRAIFLHPAQCHAAAFTIGRWPRRLLCPATCPAGSAGGAAADGAAGAGARLCALGLGGACV